MKFKISPEAHARFVEQHKAERINRSKILRERLAAKVAEHGPDSIYAEMLAEMLATVGTSA